MSTRSPLALPWLLAPLALLAPVLIAGQRGFATTTGIINAVLLAAWCVVLPLSLLRLHQLRQRRPSAAGVVYLLLLLDAIALVVCDHAPSIYGQLALALVVIFAGTGLRAGLQALRAMKAVQAPPRARMGVWVALGLGAIATIVIILAIRKGGVGLAHHSVIAAGQRELHIYNRLCVPENDKPCTPHGAFVYVRTRAVPVILFKKILPDTTFNQGQVEERAGRIFIDFGEGGPRASFDAKTYAWRAE